MVRLLRDLARKIQISWNQIYPLRRKNFFSRNEISKYILKSLHYFSQIVARLPLEKFYRNNMPGIYNKYKGKLHGNFLLIQAIFVLSALLPRRFLNMNLLYLFLLKIMTGITISKTSFNQRKHLPH